MIEIKKVIACETVKEEIKAMASPDLDLEFLEYGLHRVPHQLQKKLQERINETPDKFDHILLGYGLCSHGTLGLNSQDKKLVIPRVHDCIALLLGSRERYNKEFFGEPGTIYLSRGWIEYGGDPLTQFEDYTRRVGKENALWVMEQEYRNYKRVAYIKTPGLENHDYFVDYARRVADFINLELQILEGSTGLLQKLVSGNWDHDFLILEPGRMVIRENLF